MAGKESPKDPKALPSTGSAPEAPKKRSKLKKFVIIFVILLIILSAAGGGAYWWFFLRAPGSASEMAAQTSGEATSTAPAATTSASKGDTAPRIERPTDLPRSTGKVLPLPPFVVNLSDPTGKRYLKLGMEVEVNSDVTQALNSQSAKVRDAVIILLAGKSFADVSSPEGKILLKAEVAARLNQILGGPYVVRVYFTEFVVE